MPQPKHTSSAPSAQAPTRRSEGWPPWGFERGSLTAVVFTIGLVGWLVARSAGLLASAAQVLIYLIANLILAFDAIDLLARLWLRRAHGAISPGPSTDLGLPEISTAERSLALQPYAIVASIYNEADCIDRFMVALAAFKDVVWLIDDGSSDRTLLRLRREGWRCLRGGFNRNKPGALRYLLKTLPPEIQTVVVTDPDVRLVAAPGTERTTLERVISDLQRSGAAAVTPRVQARPGGWFEECQALEYELGCGLGRKSLGDSVCNSGVSIYRRAALEDALSRHSLSIYAEDFENSLLLLAGGERIYYDDRVIVETKAKPTWRTLLSQRVGWSYGCLKLVWERLPLFLAIGRRSPLAMYQYILYLLISGVVLLPLKLASVILLIISFIKGCDDLLMTHLLASHSWNEPLLFVLWYGKSILLLIVAWLVALPSGERRRHITTLPFYGFYALLQFVPITVGYLNMLGMSLLGQRFYKDHYSGAEAGAAAAMALRMQHEMNGAPGR